MKTLLAILLAFTLSFIPTASAELTPEEACASLEMVALLNKDNYPFWSKRPYSQDIKDACYQALKTYAKEHATSPEKIADLEAYFGGTVRVFSDDASFAAFTNENSVEENTFSVLPAKFGSLIPDVKSPQAFFTK